MVHEKSFPHVQYLAYALALLLQRRHIVIKEILKLLFGEHGINNLKNHGAVVLVQLINHVDLFKVGLILNSYLYRLVSYGMGVSLSIFQITVGDNKGLYIAGTITGRLGVEDNISISAFNGYYMGKGSPNPNDFLGWGQDFTSTSIASGLSFWQSTATASPFSTPSWRGFSRTLFSEGPGVSIGAGYSYGLYGFK